MNHYLIKQQILSRPVIDLPDGCQVVSVKHHDAYGLDGIVIPECWQVVWLEIGEADVKG